MGSPQQLTGLRDTFEGSGASFDKVIATLAEIAFADGTGGGKPAADRDRLAAIRQLREIAGALDFGWGKCKAHGDQAGDWRSDGEQERVRKLLNEPLRLERVPLDDEI